MNPRLLVIFVLIVVVPLAVLGWLGAKLVRDEQAVLAHRFARLMESQLQGIDGEIAGVLGRWQRELRADLETAPTTATELRERLRRSPIITNYFLLDNEQRLIYPSPLEELTSDERAFLTRTAEIWDGQSLTTDAPPETQAAAAALQQAKINPKSNVAAGPERREGWYAWFWGDGMHLIYWLRKDTGEYIGAELNVARLKSDIVVALPDTEPESDTLSDVRMALVDAKGAPIYEWGAFVPMEGQRPRATLALSYPLGGWSLAFYASPELSGNGLSRGLWFNVGTALGLVVIAVIGLAVYFYREYTRDIRLAAQRVSFVNQVSHELKTPLTNIRMYAELLERGLDDSDEKSRTHLGVIVSESQRLSRLIGNVLTFSRRERHTLQLRTEPARIDALIGAVLDHYRPALDAKEIETVFKPGVPDWAMVDMDVVEQIVGNLISNVEKYGADGKLLIVETSQDGNEVMIQVSDAGPGIPESERERVFEPFYRVSDRLSDGVTGTGIGLAIARELAVLHGGALILIPSERGAAFLVTLLCPRVPEGGES